MATDFVIKQLGLNDMEAAARVHRTALDDTLPWLVGLHTPEEDRWFFRERVFVESEVWGAFEGTTLTGIIAFRDDWIDHLYVLPHAQGRGVGSALLEVARAAQPHLCLWTYQRNQKARPFYEARGFVAVKETDGLDNEAKEPDVLYEWRRTATTASS